MKILTVVGKIDSRPLVYNLARALSLNGLTGIITDDGAYRRLYHGKENIGTVNNIDISICDHIDEKSIHSLDNSGTPYENLIVVSSDYISPESTGIIVCHGLDRSMMASQSEEEDDDFLLPLNAQANNEEEAKEDEDKKSKSKKKPDKEDDSKEESNESENSEDTKKEEPKEETEQERRLRIQNENPDVIVVPNDIEFTEVQIAYAAAPKKSSVMGISLKDGLISFVYKCEEQKRIEVMPDKGFNTLVSKIAAKPLGMDANELLILLSKEEGAGELAKGKAKK